MKVSMKKQYLLLCLLLLQQTVIAQDFSAVDSFFASKVSEKQLAGAITLVARDGEILHYRSYGYMDMEQFIPMDKNTILPIASMTKVITSIGIMMLQEEGKLNIDDAVEKYLPQFRHLKVLVKPDSPEIEELMIKPTIKHLLNHTSGFLYGGKSYNKAGFDKWNEPVSEFVNEITAMPLAFQPGTEWKYSYSHDILGHLIEVISGTPLNCFFKDRIFLPLGMNDTDFYIPKEKAGMQSDLFLYENGLLKSIDSKSHSIYNHLPVALSGGGGWFDSYGGLVSTVPDFYLLANWLLNYETMHTSLLSPDSVKMIISNQIGELFSFGLYKYGLGIGILETDNGETEEVFWSGSPYNTYFWVNYKHREIGIMFTNTAPYGHLDIMNKFRELIRYSVNIDK